jgi:hypothetical protein
MVYQQQPGDAALSAALSGQLNGAKVGQLALELLPALPHEVNFLPLFVPRGVARRMFQQPTTLPAAQLTPPAGIPAANQVAVQPAQVRNQEPAQPAQVVTAPQVVPHNPHNPGNVVLQGNPARYRPNIAASSPIPAARTPRYLKPALLPRYRAMASGMQVAMVIGMGELGDSFGSSCLFRKRRQGR